MKAEIDKELLLLREWQDNQFNFQKAKKEYEKTAQRIDLLKKAATEDLELLKLRRDQIQTRIESSQDDLDALEIKSPVAGTVVYEMPP